MAHSESVYTAGIPRPCSWTHTVSGCWENPEGQLLQPFTGHGETEALERRRVCTLLYSLCSADTRDILTCIKNPLVGMQHLTLLDQEKRPQGSKNWVPQQDSVARAGGGQPAICPARLTRTHRPKEPLHLGAGKATVLRSCPLRLQLYFLNQVLFKEDHH